VIGSVGGLSKPAAQANAVLTVDIETIFPPGAVIPADLPLRHEVELQDQLGLLIRT